MGTWGSGNFDNDTSAEHLAHVIGQLVDEVTGAMTGDPVELEPDEYWGNAVPCHLELLHALAQAGYVTHQHLPHPDVIAGWKRDFMAVWERTIDGLGPSPAFRAERRAVLDRTFDQLAGAATDPEAPAPQRMS